MEADWELCRKMFAREGMFLHLSSNTSACQWNCLYNGSVVLRCSFPQCEFTSGTWEERFEEINFADFKFDITHHFLKQEHVRNDQKEEPEEGRVMYVLRFVEEKEMRVDG